MSWVFPFYQVVKNLRLTLYCCYHALNFVYENRSHSWFSFQSFNQIFTFMQSTFSISLNLSQKHTTELIIITRATFFILIIRIKIERAVVRIVVTTCWIRLGRLRCVFKLTHNRVKLHSLILQRVWIRIRLRFYFNTFHCIL